MVSTAKDPVLAVLSLSGGNDGLNTVIPRNNSYYRDFRPTIGVPEEQILPINDELGFHPTMAPLMKFWEAGQLAVFVGIGYPDSQLLPLPQHGHLAHLRARNHRYRGLAGPRRQADGPQRRERADLR